MREYTPITHTGVGVCLWNVRWRRWRLDLKRLVFREIATTLTRSMTRTTTQPEGWMRAQDASCCAPGRCSSSIAAGHSLPFGRWNAESSVYILGGFKRQTAGRCEPCVEVYRKRAECTTTQLTKRTVRQKYRCFSLSRARRS